MVIETSKKLRTSCERNRKMKKRRKKTKTEKTFRGNKESRATAGFGGREHRDTKKNKRRDG